VRTIKYNNSTTEELKMKLIRNLLAIIGLVALIAVGVTWNKFEADIQAFRALDPQAGDTYMTMWSKLKDSGNSAEATVWSVPFAAGVDWETAEDAMKAAARDVKMMFVAEQHVSKAVESRTRQPQRFLKIYQFCDPLIAVNMVTFSPAFSAYLPCRIAMLEDAEGQFHLYTLNMDMMIHGGKPLEGQMRDDAQSVKAGLQEIMRRGAAGQL
jgi:uncharacterized protein (DUF302 family)